ncbi:MAG TPA: hypothetical protein VM262_09680 [Acidimicrobiales bacterium]|nr:hypothetical protein [Acidimicrobiales bacterium]
MIRLRRHPDGGSLSAWYDGELVDPRLSAHVDECERCWATVRRFVDVDEAVRASRLPPRTDVRSRLGVQALAAMAAVAAVVAVLVVAVPTDRSRPPQHVAGAGGTASSTIAPTLVGPVDPPNPRPPSQDLAATGRTSAAGPSAAATGADALQDLRLGVPLPGGDPRSSPLAAEVWHAARAAVAGRPGVEVVPVIAGDRAPAGVDAVVGGWSAPAPVLVQTADGVIVAADPDPERAGALLADAAVGDAELVGVIRSSGPDAAFGDGVAATRRVVVVELDRDSSCDREVRRVLSRGAVAIALAAPPPAVRTCLAAVEASGARPPRGVLVPPSMMLEPESPRVAELDVLGLVGLPMPTSDTPGAARFREHTGGRSYRAMLTFAGVEIAVALDAAGPDIASAWRREPTWSSDLVAYDGGRNVGIHAVRAARDGWEHHWDGGTTFGDRGGG